jgi:outer membrane protein assembly factor BamB
VRAVQATVTAAIAPFTRERFEDIERSVLLPRAEGRAEELLTAARVVDAQGQVQRYDLVLVDALQGETLWPATLTVSPEAIRLLQFDADYLAWTDGATVSVHLRRDASPVWSDLQLVRLDNCPGNSCFRVRNGAVLVVDPDRELLARELSTGNVRWTYTLGGARVLGDLGNELVIVRDRGSQTFGLDLVNVTTGATREFSPTCEVERRSFSVGRNNLTLSPVGDVYYLVFAGEPACIQSYDLNTNALNWSQPVTAFEGSLRAEAGGAYVNTGNGVVRFDQQTGQATTLADTGGRVMLDVVGDMLLMRDEDSGERGLAVVETGSGLTRWSRVLDGQPLEGGGAVAAFSRLSSGQSVWAARYTEAGWLLMIYRPVAADRAELQVERLAWADGTAETLFSLPITAPSGEVTAPSLLALRDSSYWWTFDDRYILRLDLAAQSLTSIWPP